LFLIYRICSWNRNVKFSANLTYTGLVAGIRYHFVYTTFIVVMCHIAVSGSNLLLYSIPTFKCCLYICVFKEVGNFPDFRTVVIEGGPFIAFVVSFVCLFLILYLCIQF
jgi:hypothetical protein